jgi:hypothetical protein
MREEERWDVVEMACGHVAMIAEPDELAGILTG